MTILRLILLFTPSFKYTIQKAFVREIGFLDIYFYLDFACLRPANRDFAQAGVSNLKFSPIKIGV
jgi:hypothetical protein